MRQSKFLNAFLVANTLALVMLLWVLWSGNLGVPSSASASGPGTGLLNPADQRNEMIAELKQLNTAVEELREELRKIEHKVHVVSLPDESSNDSDL